MISKRTHSRPLPLVGLLLVAVALLLPQAALAQYSGSGSGTEKDPYVIYNVTQLNQVRNFQNNTAVYFSLMKDLDLTEWTATNSPTQGWNPIGVEASPFKGHFDGNSHTISGLTVSRTSASYVGLFGYVSGAVIKGLTVSGSVKGKDHVGLLVGYQNGGSLTGCKATGTVSGSQKVGGLAGSVLSMSVTKCKAEATIRGSQNVGGLAGYAESTSLADCYAQPTLTATGDNAGGLVGYFYCNKSNITMTGCATTGSVTSTGNCVGGIVGYVYSCKVHVNDVFSTATLHGGNYTGGLFGKMEGWDSSAAVIVDNSYYAGELVGAESVGGLAGYTEYTSFAHSYANACVTGRSKVGGLVGEVYDYTDLKTNVSLCPQIVGVSGVGRIYGGIAKGASGYSIGILGTAETNRALTSTKVVVDGHVVTCEDSGQQGESLALDGMHLRATYQGLGWDFSHWTILETETLPYKSTQCAPPTFQQQPMAGMTALMGRSINGGTVSLTTGGDTYQAECAGDNTWMTRLTPLQAGSTVSVSVTSETLLPSYPTTLAVGYRGQGTEAQPYEVYTAADLQAISGDAWYKLMNDIDLSSWGTWTPLGYLGASTVHLDGGGHFISGLRVEGGASGGTGLFAATQGATVRDLTLTDATVTGGDCSALLVGKASATTISNCTVKGTVKGGAAAGLLVGSGTNTHVSACLSRGTVSGTGATGGMAGRMSGGEIARSTSTAAVSSTGTTTGGLVGENAAAITDCNATGTVTTAQDEGFAGGIAGLNKAAISRCYASGNMSGTTHWAGGIAGYNDGAAATVSHCVATAERMEYTNSTAVAMRVYGGCRNGAVAGSEADNLASKQMIVSLNAIPQYVEDDPMNGTGTATDLLLKAATYKAMEWDMKTAWTIDETATLPYHMAFGAGDTDDTSYQLYADDTQAYTGEQVVVPVMMKNVGEVVGYQFDMVLPQGFTVARDADDELMVQNGYRTTDRKHVVSATLTDERLRVLVYSMDNKPLSGNEGEVCRVTLLPQTGVGNGNYSVTLKNIRVSSPDFRSISANPTSFAVKIKNDYLTVADVQTAAATRLTLPVAMTNHTDIVSYQMDITLPDGLSLQTGDDGAYLFTHGQRTTAERHQISTSLRPDGRTVRVLCYSMDNYAFTGNTGTLLLVPVQTADGMEDGDYKVKFSNVFLSTAEYMSIPVDDFETTVSVETSKYIQGDVNIDGRVDIADVSGTCSLVHDSTNAKLDAQAADMNGDGRIEVTDVSLLATYIHDMTMKAPSRRAPRRAATVTAASSGVEDYTASQLYIEPFAIAPGEEREIGVMLHNPDQPFCGMQCDLYLPEGITPVLDEDEPTQVAITATARGKKYVYSSSFQKTGAIRFLGYNINNTDWKETQGAIFTFRVKAAADIKPGVKEARMSYIVLTHGGIGYYCPEGKSTLVCGQETAATNVTLQGRYTDASAAEVCAAITSPTLTWIDLRQAYVDDLTTAFTSQNPNCLSLYDKTQRYPKAANVVHEDVCEQMTLTSDHAFDAPFEIYAHTVTLTRSGVRAGEWETAVLPFAWSPNADVETAVADSYDEKTGTLSLVSSAPTSCKPFVFRAAQGETVTFTAGNVDVGPTSAGLQGDDHFFGTFTTAEKNCWDINGHAVTNLLPFRAYLGGDSQPRVSLNGVTVGIDRLEAGDDAASRLYDLRGVAQPKHSRLPAGVYIRGGRKVVRK